MAAPCSFGTSFWRCPEGKPDKAADIWSCAAFTEWAPALPAGGGTCHSDAAVQDRACFEGRAWWEYQLPASIQPHAADLVRTALQPRGSRIDAAEVERHEWMP